MKTRTKVFGLIMAAVMLVTVSVFTTMAYLTDSKTVTNTFTVGQVHITLDEANVDGSTDGVSRDTENRYHLMPGHEYTKDPIIHVDADSENCWVFVTVNNQIADIEASAAEKMANGTSYSPITTQITANGWQLLADTTDVYYKAWRTTDSSRDLPVFENFMVSGSVDADTLAAYEPTTSGEGEDAVTTYKSIIVTGYAVQMDGFEDDPAGAWAVFGTD